MIELVVLFFGIGYGIFRMMAKPIYYSTRLHRGGLAEAYRIGDGSSWPVKGNHWEIGNLRLQAETV